MIQWCIVFVVIIGGWITAFGQNQSDETFDLIKVHIGGSFQIGVPLNSFKDNLEGEGFGGGGEVFYRLGQQPLFIGAMVSGLSYDQLTQEFTADVGGFLKEFELQTNSNILLAHAGFRLQPAIDFPILPYIDGLVGLKNLTTRTKLKDLELQEDNVLENRKEKGDVAFSYGGTIGIMVDVFRNSDIVIDLKCSYLPGANASYLVKRSDISGITFNDPIDAFEEKASPTDLLVPQIGITVRIAQWSNTEDVPDEW